MRIADSPGSGRGRRARSGSGSAIGPTGPGQPPGVMLGAPGGMVGMGAFPQGYGMPFPGFGRQDPYAAAAAYGLHPLGEACAPGGVRGARARVARRRRHARVGGSGARAGLSAERRAHAVCCPVPLLATVRARARCAGGVAMFPGAAGFGPAAYGNHAAMMAAAGQMGGMGVCAPGLMGAAPPMALGGSMGAMPPGHMPAGAAVGPGPGPAGGMSPQAPGQPQPAPMPQMQQLTQQHIATMQAQQMLVRARPRARGARRQARRARAAWGDARAEQLARPSTHRACGACAARAQAMQAAAAGLPQPEPEAGAAEAAQFGVSTSAGPGGGGLGPGPRPAGGHQPQLIPHAQSAAAQQQAAAAGQGGSSDWVRAWSNPAARRSRGARGQARPLRARATPALSRE